MYPAKKGALNNERAKRKLNSWLQKQQTRQSSFCALSAFNSSLLFGDYIQPQNTSNYVFFVSVKYKGTSRSFRSKNRTAGALQTEVGSCTIPKEFSAQRFSPAWTHGMNVRL
jgi:hypothetical protein